MIKAIRNVVGVSIIFMVGILFFVAYLEYRFDDDYYEKEDCIEVTVTSISREKISKPGKKYEYYAQVTYYTDSGHKKTGYMRDGMDKTTDIGDKITAVKDKYGTIRPVKRDWITWKYVEIGESNNTLLYLSIALMIGGIVYFILISMKQETVVCCIMTLCGIGLKIYSYIHEGALEIAIGRIGIGIMAIAIVMLLIVRAAMTKERTDSGLSTVNNEIDFNAMNEYSEEKVNRSPSIFKRMISLLGNKISSLGNKKYTYLGVVYFAVAMVLMGVGIYLIWGRGDYSGYKYVKAVVVDIEPYNTYEDGEVISRKYSAELEFCTDSGEKRTYITGCVFDEDNKDFHTGDELEVGYKGDKVVLLKKNSYTGKFEAYNSSNAVLFMVAGLFVLIGIYVATKMTSEGKKRFIRGIGWILFGISFEFGYVVLTGKARIVWIIGMPTLIGVLKCIRAILFMIKQRNEGINYGKAKNRK